MNKKGVKIYITLAPNCCVKIGADVQSALRGSNYFYVEENDNYEN